MPKYKKNSNDENKCNLIQYNVKWLKLLKTSPKNSYKPL